MSEERIKMLKKALALYGLQYSVRWCDYCKRWVAYYDESTVVRCPYCYNDLTIEKPPEEEKCDG